jgi:hypothetical protein
MFGGSAKNSAGRDNGEDSEDRDKDETEDEKKNEHLVVMVTRAIRNKMISPKLVGSIMIHHISAIIRSLSAFAIGILLYLMQFCFIKKV